MNPDSKTTDARWYYAENDATLGPVNLSTLEAYVRAGTITPETLVVPEGREDWKPLASYLPNAAPHLGAQASFEMATSDDGGQTGNSRETAQAQEGAQAITPASIRPPLRESQPVEVPFPSEKVKHWFKKGAMAYGGFVMAFLLASWASLTGAFFTLIFLGSWAALTLFLLRKKASKIVAIGGSFILSILATMLAEGVLLAPFAVGVAIQEDKEIGTGITYAQITGNGLGENFNMERSSDVDGRPRYMGQTNPAAAIFEVQGDKSDIFSASLILAVPRDSRATTIHNAALAMRFLTNADNGWDDDSRNEWLQMALRQIGGGEKEVTLRRGNIRYSLSDLRPLGFSLSLRSAGD